MRKLIISLISLLFLSGCFHEFDEINRYLEPNEEQDKIDLVNGIYSRLVRVHNGNYFEMLSRSDDVNVYSNYNFRKGSNPEFEWPERGIVGCSSIGSEPIPSSTTISEIYVNLYAAIINANNLICKLSDTDDGYLLGEVYFLRAYCFFKLARFFGNPPLIIDTDVNYLIEKPSFSEVYQLIEDDMLNAIELLPNSNSDSRVPGETPHVGTAKALLAEIYLTMAGYPLNDQSKYAAAAKLSKEVIDNAEIYNFELIPDIANLIVNSNEHCPEHIFALYNKLEASTSNSTLSNIHLSNFSDEDHDPNLLITYSPEFKFYKKFPHNYRKGVFLNLGRYVTSNFYTPDSTFVVLNYELIDPIKDVCAYLDDVTYLKYTKLTDFEEDETASTSFGKHVNVYLLRYAQTLLTYAEAKARSGDLDQSAYEAVNMIRRRANKLDVNTPSEFDLPGNLSTEEFIDSVVWERAWELSFEPDGRWFDLVRLDMKEHLSELRYDFDLPSEVVEDLLTSDWYFYQIPQEDRWLNPNL